MSWTTATPIRLLRALFAASQKTKAAFSAPFRSSASPLDATFPGTLVCVANKRLGGMVSPLDATLTKNRGRGVLLLTRKSQAGSLSRGASRRPKIPFSSERISFPYIPASLLPYLQASSAPRSSADHNGRIPGGFFRRSVMSKRIRTWMIPALAGVALFYLQAAAAQQEPDWSKVQIKVTKVSGNIYMLEGQGGNIAASVGEDGIVIVDDQFAPLAEKIQAALKELKITDKPVRFVINTHYHEDHTGGNVPFNNAGSTLIAQDNVRKRLESGGTAGNGGSIKMEIKPAAKAALPIITF